MEANSSIIIYLNKRLEVYSFTEAVNKFTVLKILEPNHLGRLELASRFMDFWLELEGWLGGIDSPVFFWIGPKAGFTDTRIVFIWLRTKWLVSKLTSQKWQFWTMRLSLDTLSDLDVQEISNLKQINQTQPDASLRYAAEPRLGKSK